MYKLSAITVLIFISLSIGCSKNKSNNSSNNPPVQDNCNGIDSHFATKVFPIIQSSCATNSGCHGNGSTNGPGALTNYSQISNAASAIRTAVISGAMPKNGTLGATEKNIIICWVNSGAPNN